MNNLYEKEVGSVGHTNLFASTTHPVDVKAVTLKAGQGIVKRGTVLGIATTTQLATTVDGSKTDGTELADSILTDDVDTGEASSTVNVVATAYSSGSFNRQALLFGGTDKADKHEKHLRELGIFMKDNLKY
ncbi:head decoration protein [Brevibacillus laterosporus]|uniref:head decoration protein n=1 Tax=Brevibacillus laterosporus TaxID=1465 RepID=UPI003D1A63EE